MSVGSNTRAFSTAEMNVMGDKIRMFDSDNSERVDDTVGIAVSVMPTTDNRQGSDNKWRQAIFVVWPHAIGWSFNGYLKEVDE